MPGSPALPATDRRALEIGSAERHKATDAGTQNGGQRHDGAAVEARLTRAMATRGDGPVSGRLQWRR